MWLASFICDQMEQYLTHLWLVYDQKGRRPIGWWVSSETRAAQAFQFRFRSFTICDQIDE